MTPPETASPPLDETQAPASIEDRLKPRPIAIADIDRSSVHRKHGTKAFEASIAKLMGEMAGKTPDDHSRLQQPIRVYEGILDPERPGKLLKRIGGKPFVLGFGDRRLTSAESLTWTHIPAQVFPPALASEIQEARALENLGREDLGVLEEMEMVVQLVEACGGGEAGINEAAGRLGQPRKYITDRLFLERLSPHVRAGVEAEKINLAHARELAKLPDHKAQDEIFGWFPTRMDHGLPESAIRNSVAARTQSLHGVPWELSVPFAGKPACDQCPHNSANALELFESDDKDRAPRCAMKQCYDAKASAAAKDVQATAKRASKNISNGVGPKSEVVAELKPAHIKTTAVESAMRAAEPGKPPTRGRAAGPTMQEVAAQKLQDAIWKHREKVDAIVDAALYKSPEALLTALLLARCPTIQSGLQKRNSKGELQGGAGRLFDAAMKFNAASVAALAKDTIGGYSHRRHSEILGVSENWPEPLADRLFEALGIKDKIPARPKLEDFLPKEPAKPPPAVHKMGGPRKRVAGRSDD